MAITFREIYENEYEHISNNPKVFLVYEDRNGSGHGIVITENELLDLCRQIEEYYGLDKPQPS